MIELALNVVVIAVFVSLILPAGLSLLEKAKTQSVIKELKEIATDIEKFNVDNKTYPDSLDEVYRSTRLDPWKNPYQYLKIIDIKNKDKNKIRKKKNQSQLNNKFDLYSMGPDGKSQAPLTAQSSRDDVIYADNGRFIGFVVDYY